MRPSPRREPLHRAAWSDRPPPRPPPRHQHAPGPGWNSCGQRQAHRPLGGDRGQSFLEPPPGWKHHRRRPLFWAGGCCSGSRVRSPFSRDDGSYHAVAVKAGRNGIRILAASHCCCVFCFFSSHTCFGWRGGGGYSGAVPAKARRLSDVP